jgi:hypothetical protein
MEIVNRKKKLRRRLLETSKYWARSVLDGVLGKWQTNMGKTDGRGESVG